MGSYGRNFIAVPLRHGGTPSMIIFRCSLVIFVVVFCALQPQLVNRFPPYAVHPRIDMVVGVPIDVLEHTLALIPMFTHRKVPVCFRTDSFDAFTFYGSASHFSRN